MPESRCVRPDQRAERLWDAERLVVHFGDGPHFSAIGCEDTRIELELIATRFEFVALNVVHRIAVDFHDRRTTGNTGRAQAGQKKRTRSRLERAVVARADDARWSSRKALATGVDFRKRLSV